MARREWAPSTCAAARARACCRCSPAAGRSGGCAPARCPPRSWPGSARRAASPAPRWRRKRRDSPPCATTCWPGWPRRLPGLRVNGSTARRLPGNLNVTLPHGDALDVMRANPGLCVSTGSACSSAAVAPSYVLTAMGLDAASAARTLRMGLGRFYLPVGRGLRHRGAVRRPALCRGLSTMPKMTFVERNGIPREVSAPLGLSVLEVAHKHGVRYRGRMRGLTGLLHLPRGHRSGVVR